MSKFIAVNRENAISVFMGYNINVGWRCQPDITLRVPYVEWLEFNKNISMFKLSPRANDIHGYFLDLALAQYQEVMYANGYHTDATPILAYNIGSESIGMNDLINKVKSISSYALQPYILQLQEESSKYYSVLTHNRINMVSLDTKHISPWNLNLYYLAIAYIICWDALFTIHIDIGGFNNG